MTVKELITELSKYPPDAVCYGYNGEDNGVAIGSGGELGFIHASEYDDDVRAAWKNRGR